jgi:hypothetical protein
VQSDVKGRTEPRIFTPPLRELTPETSYGFDVIEFAEVIGWPLDPWQKWAVIHLGELKEDNTPRFRFALLLVARQNGKTLLCRILILYWMFVEQFPIIIATSTKRETAKFSWQEVIKMARNNEILKAELPAIHTRETIGEEAFFNYADSRYMFAAPNRNAGRSYSVDRALLDELRDHKNQDTYDGLINAGNARMNFQAVAITNQGDDTSVVLEDQRSAAIEFIETGVGDPSTFLAEWSSPQGSDPTDLNALAYANPNLGVRIPVDALMGQALQSKSKGGVKLARFKTEIMCMKVHLLDPAIEPELWDLCGGLAGEKYPKIEEFRRNMVFCLDVSIDASHASLVAVAKVGNQMYCDVIKTWFGFGCTKSLRSELPELVSTLKPRAFGWFPGGPAAVVASDLKSKNSTFMQWPPRGVQIMEFSAEDVPSICMGLSETVHTAQLAHPKNEMLTGQIKQTQKLKRGDRWVFTRSTDVPIDATYALAGAVHMTRSLPAPLKPVSTGRDPGF